MGVHLQREIVMNQVDLAIGDIVLNHRAQRIFKEAAARRALIVAEDFHGDGRVAVADSLYGSAGGGVCGDALAGGRRGSRGGGRRSLRGDRRGEYCKANKDCGGPLSKWGHAADEWTIGSGNQIYLLSLRCQRTAIVTRNVGDNAPGCVAVCCCWKRWN